MGTEALIVVSVFALLMLAVALYANKHRKHS
jgi:hypothetical protein